MLKVTLEHEDSILLGCVTVSLGEMFTDVSKERVTLTCKIKSQNK
jgi:hypothetical protein